MTRLQQRIGVGGAIVCLFLLLYLPWRLDYERGYSHLAYSFFFSPPNDFRRVEDNRSIAPQSVHVDGWMLLGELVAVAAVTGFLLWLYQPPAIRTEPQGGSTIGSV